MFRCRAVFLFSFGEKEIETFWKVCEIMMVEEKDLLKLFVWISKDGEDECVLQNEGSPVFLVLQDPSTKAVVRGDARVLVCTPQ